MSPRSTLRTVLIEIGLFLGAALAADAVWGSGNRFLHVEPHPFWIIVLLMAAQYGTREALLATGASSVALLAGNLPPQSLDQDVHQYTVQLFVQPLLWLLAAVVIGELRTRHRQAHAESEAKRRDAERRVALLTRSHTDLTAARDRLATRLAGQLQTAAGVIEAARPIETLDPDRVLAGVGDLLRAALNVKACSLFLLKGEALTLVAAEGWSGRLQLPQRYSGSSPLFREIVGAQHFVSVATPDGERLLGGEGLMAGPVVDPATGTLFGMLKVEEMPFLDFNVGSLHTLKAVCAWVAAAYGKAVAHQASRIEDEATRLYSLSYLERQSKYLTEVALRFGFDLTLLSFRVQVDELPAEARQALPGVLGRVSREVLRGTDLVFSHQPPGTQFSVLLPGATAEGALAAARKLVAAVRAASGYDVPCTTQVQALCVASEAAGQRWRRSREAKEATVA
jgi:hypothetical protein